MKLLMIAAFALALHGQKVETPPAPPTLPSERVLSDNEGIVKDLKISLLQEKLLNDQYKIEEWTSKHAPIAAEQQRIRMELCLSVGVPKDKVFTNECYVQGFADDGSQMKAPDGTLVPRKVVHVIAPADKTK